MRTRTPTHASVTRSQAQQPTQAKLLDLDMIPAVSTASTPHAAILSQEDAYLCAWLQSRLDLATLPVLMLREESALTATPSDQRQIWRLLQQARRRGLAIAEIAQGRAA